MDAQPSSSDRLVRLEESIGFTQHDIDQLSERVKELEGLVFDLSKRLARAEHRLESANHPPDESQES